MLFDFSRPVSFINTKIVELVICTFNVNSIQMTSGITLKSVLIVKQLLLFYRNINIVVNNMN